MLTKAQTEQFWRDGFLVVEDAVTPGELAAMRREVEGWVEVTTGLEGYPPLT